MVGGSGEICFVLTFQEWPISLFANGADELRWFINALNYRMLFFPIDNPISPANIGTLFKIYNKVQSDMANNKDKASPLCGA